MGHSTLDQVHPPTPRVRGVAARRAGTAVLAVFVLAGLVGLLGVRVGTAQATEAGYAVSVRHATLARAGLAVPWEVTVEAEGGFGPELVLAVGGDYLDLFDHHAFYPEPSEMTRDADWVYFTFAPPDATTLVVSFDGYIESGAQHGASGEVAVVEPDGSLVALTRFSTQLVP